MTTISEMVTWFILILILFVLSIYIALIWKMKRLSTQLKPIHIYLFNFTGLTTVLIVFNVITIIRSIFDLSENCVYQYVWLFVRLSYNGSILLLQMDRFLSLYLPLRYKSIVTQKHVIVSVAGSKSLAFCIVNLVYQIYPSYSICPISGPEFRFRDVNVLFDAIPSILVSVIVVANMVFADMTKRRLDARVSPNDTNQESENQEFCVRRLASFILKVNFVTSSVLLI